MEQKKAEGNEKENTSKIRRSRPDAPIYVPPAFRQSRTATSQSKTNVSDDRTKKESVTSIRTRQTSSHSKTGKLSSSNKKCVKSNTDQTISYDKRAKKKEAGESTEVEKPVNICDVPAILSRLSTQFDNRDVCPDGNALHHLYYVQDHKETWIYFKDYIKKLPRFNSSDRRKNIPQIIYSEKNKCFVISDDKPCNNSSQQGEPIYIISDTEKTLNLEILVLDSTHSLVEFESILRNCITNCPEKRISKERSAENLVNGIKQSLYEVKPNEQQTLDKNSESVNISNAITKNIIIYAKQVNNREEKRPIDLPLIYLRGTAHLDESLVHELHVRRLPIIQNSTDHTIVHETNTFRNESHTTTNMNNATVNATNTTPNINDTVVNIKNTIHNVNNTVNVYSDNCNILSNIKNTDLKDNQSFQIIDKVIRTEKQEKHEHMKQENAKILPNENTPECENLSKLILSKTPSGLINALTDEHEKKECKNPDKPASLKNLNNSPEETNTIINTDEPKKYEPSKSENLSKNISPKNFENSPETIKTNEQEKLERPKHDSSSKFVSPKTLENPSESTEPEKMIPIIDLTVENAVKTNKNLKDAQNISNKSSVKNLKDKNTDEEFEEFKRASEGLNRTNKRIVKSFSLSDVLIINKDSDENEANKIDNWEDLFDENGEIDDNLLKEASPHAEDEESTKISKSKSDNMDYKNRKDEQRHDLEHVVEIYGFPAEFQTRDLLVIFEHYKPDTYHIKWVDDNHALGVFASENIAIDVLKIEHPLIKLRPMNEASKQSIAKAKKNPGAMMPVMARPQTCPQTARRMVSGALGIKLKNAKEEREKEKQILKEARERKRLAVKQQDDAWEGRYTK